MKRIFAKITSAILITCFTAFLAITPAYAAGNHRISFTTGNTTTTGKQITVRMTSKFSSPVKNLSGSVTFDNNLVQYTGVGRWIKDQDVSKKDGSIQIDKTVTDNDRTQIIELVFTAINPGSAQFSFSFEGKKADNSTESASATEKLTITGQSVKPAVPDESLQVTYEDKNYTIINDENTIPGLPNFDRVHTKYNDVDINTLTDSNKKYILFYLTENETGKTQWFYLTESGALEPLEYITVNDDIYIIEMPNTQNKEPEGDWQTGKCTLTNGLTVDCFESKTSVMSDFYIFLCYHNGESSYFRYDKATDVLQREPGFMLVEYQPVETSSQHGFISRLSVLSTEAKALIFLSLLELILIVALIVLIVLRRRRAALPEQDEI